MPVFFGTPGNDVLTGTSGADVLNGLGGDDLLIGDAGLDRLDGGDGTDTVSYAGSATGVTADLLIRRGAGGDAEGDQYFFVENLTGSGFADVLIGDSRDNVLSGGAGRDRLEGGRGADALIGGDGVDIAVYLGAGFGISANLANATGLAGDAAGDRFSGIEGIIGSEFADILYGSSGDDLLFGRAGDDTILGRAGDDRIRGDAGADVLSGGAGRDTLLYTLSDQGVAVNLSLGTAAGGHAGGDVISGFENVIGSRHDDTLTGRGGSNRLIGGGGDDTLRGMAGDDRLSGGAGADVLDGGAGFDVVSYVNATTNAIINLRNDMHARAAAGDTFISIEGLRGTQLGDSLIMGNGDNRIWGMGGDDFLDGGDGDDVLIGGAGADFLHGGEGVDTAAYVGSDAAVQISMENHTTEGGHAEGDVLSWIHNIIGSRFGDMLEGNILANHLRGHDGDDTLIGRAGIDRLTGGAGADSFGFVDPDDHAAATQSGALALAGYVGSTADLITDFESGTDLLQFDALMFSGSVFNTNDIADLGLAAAGDSAFAFTGSDLFYVSYATAADAAADLVTVRHLAHLDGVAALTAADFEFV
ncbi:hypothetical protein LCL97_04930 [Seohaeicola saemankumensis]|nr:calcium-binding protein [Seohaeicola saemankumensis]MCA0870153.1 hypothetical protein [Seohaeicola saemankumensis]